MTNYILNDLPQQKVSGSTMKHPHIRTGRSLAGMVLILFGLSAYGCGDSATVTEPATLGNLSVSEGTLEPRFSPDTTSYTVQLSTDVSSTTITATPRVAGDTIRIDNQLTSTQTIDLDSPGTEKSVNIVVTETGTGGTSKSYTVRVKRAPLAGDNSLANLIVSPGTLTPSFDKNSLRYTVSVENNIGSITVTPTLSDPLATMTVNGQPADSGQPRSINLAGGNQVTTITFTITAQDGSTKSYEVAASRRLSKNLGGLTVSPGTLAPAFRADRTAYTVNVGSTVESVRVTPTLADSRATMTVNGQPTTSGQPQTIGLGIPGSPTVITISVIVPDEPANVYSVTVNRAALNGINNLSALTVSPGSLAPTFQEDRTTYTVNVGSAVESVRVTPTLADPRATMTVNGQPTPSGQQSQPIGLGIPGSPTIITIIAIAQNGTPKSYSVTVNRAALNGNNNLSALTVSPGSLAPTFQEDRTTYTVNVGSAVESVRVTPTLADSRATMTVNGQPTPSGQQSQPIGLGIPGSPTIITIIAIAQNGTPKSYSITVNRAALGANNNLSALTVSPGTLDSPFSANDLSYTVNVGSTVESVRVRPTLADSRATMTVNGQAVTSGQQSGPITLNPAGGQPTGIQIVVTAQNQTTKTYSVTVVRPPLGANSNLSALTVSPGTFDSPFNANDLSYTVTVGSAVENVTVSATKDDANATMALGSVTVPPGTASGQANFPLEGAGGANTIISVTVTAQNGVNVNTYTLSVFRPAAPTAPARPTSTPDLLTADDSCPLIPGSTLCFAGSNTDNITNVKRPGFSVPLPGPGETAKLYMDGNEIPTSATPSGNTLILRPNADLPDGSYDVTYTLSNAVGESDDSPEMTPQLEINTIIINN